MIENLKEEPDDLWVWNEFPGVQNSPVGEALTIVYKYREFGSNPESVIEMGTPA